MEVFTEYKDVWEKEDRDLELLYAADRSRRSHLPERTDAAQVVPAALAPPRPSTLETWYRSWVGVGRNIRILIPLDAKKGNRTPRLPNDIYERMKLYIETFYLTLKQSPLRYAYRQLMKELKPRGLYVSYESLRHYHNKHWSEFEDDRKRIGWRKAYVEHDVFRRTHPPEHALEEVEIDHCLIDLIVVDEVSGRPLGRPWLTVMLDRATRMILGCHLSFRGSEFRVTSTLLSAFILAQGTGWLGPQE